VGNCCDATWQERQVSRERAEELAAEFNVPYFECSAKTDKHIEEVFSSAAQEAYRFLFNASFGVLENLIKRGDLAALTDTVAKLSKLRRMMRRDEVSVAQRKWIIV
jgi:hypothetical protein